MLRCFVLECHEQPLRVSPSRHEYETNNQTVNLNFAWRRKVSKLPPTFSGTCGFFSSLVVKVAKWSSNNNLKAVNLLIFSLRYTSLFTYPCRRRRPGSRVSAVQEKKSYWSLTVYYKKEQGNIEFYFFTGVFNAANTEDKGTYQSRNVNAIMKRIKMNPTAVTA